MAVAGVVPASPYVGETARWWLESCVGIGSVKMGLPGIAAFAPVLAPLPTIRQVQADKSTGKLPLLPYSAMLVNYFSFMAVGIVSGLPAVWLPNIVGFAAGAYYTTIFLRHCPDGADWLPLKAWHHKLGVLASIGAVTSIGVFLPEEEAFRLLTVICATGMIATFGGPLAAIKTVLREKSTRSLPFLFTLATLLNCSLWLIYWGLVVPDAFMAFPNVMGVASAAVQLWLFGRFGIYRIV